MPEIYLTGYGDLQPEGSDSRQGWRVETASYDNVNEISLARLRPNLNALPVDNSPIRSRSLLNFMQGHMEALTIEQALMDNLGESPVTPSRALSQIDWSLHPPHDELDLPGRGETTIP